MRCSTFNEHPQFHIEDVGVLCSELQTFVPIHYDEVSVAFLTEATIRHLHKNFLDDVEPTDVITFPADITDKERVGEICISVDEALKYTHFQPLADELTLYLIHGWLHLADYNDIADSDRQVMRHMEKRTFGFLDTQQVKRIEYHFNKNDFY